MSVIKWIVISALAVVFFLPLILVAIGGISDRRKRKKAYKNRDPKFWIEMYALRDEYMDDIYGEDLSTRKEVINN